MVRGSIPRTGSKNMGWYAQGTIQMEEYPTMDEVMEADPDQIYEWWRLLSSPGESVIGSPNFDKVLKREIEVMHEIANKYKFDDIVTSTIPSKIIGWGDG